MSVPSASVPSQGPHSDDEDMSEDRHQQDPITTENFANPLLLLHQPEAQDQAAAHSYLECLLSENKIDHIARNIEELNRTVSQFTLAQSGHGSFSSANASRLSHSTHPSPYSLEPTATPSSSAPTPLNASSTVSDHNQTPALKPEYEGESSLFAHAVFATRFLQNAVNNNPTSEIALEMTSVLDALRNTVDAQKQQTDTLESLYPNARPLPPGSDLQQLPRPSTDRALACLRMAQESARVQALWFMEFQTVGQFTAHFIKVCSPGPATEAELIIVYAGLYWLFLECANVVSDHSLKQEYHEQATLCRDNLETVLYRLPFHLPTTLDNAYALSMAGLYCLQKCKSSAAWTFICMASHQTQALGLHSAMSLHGETPEARRYKMWLFWLIYTIEKVLALRMGRSSTIRDSDITLPQMSNELSSDSWWSDIFPIWIGMSALQGRIFDEIYSPKSLAEPESVRTPKAQAIAAEAKRLIAASDDLQRVHNETRSQTLGAGLNELLWRADRVTSLSMLTLIYRGIPPDKPGSSVFCNDCITTARDALIEHEKCLAILSDRELQSDYFEFYVTWALLQSPFIPFIVVFCHIIETSDSSDLDYLKRLVEVLQSASSNSTSYVICQRHLRIFKALYDVAVKYFEVKAKKAPEAMLGPTRINMTEYLDPTLSQVPTFGMRAVQNTQQNQMLGDDYNVGMDPPEAELATWFYTNHQMMRMLGDM
ncbi:hypothetical protein AK830_g7558 [Neonectria ditissima]|uniref:Xylanolytic transcriptional activator regulatory domain-containing protein n=1 Tax=Neonectria ditissima TaxID=78410 RepID=A0A0P7BG11_9HYPO|nr:hypothetical protein AK830_g7558 [Neonectria ditissima]